MKRFIFLLVFSFALISGSCLGVYLFVEKEKRMVSDILKRKIDYNIHKINTIEMLDEYFLSGFYDIDLIDNYNDDFNGLRKRITDILIMRDSIKYYEQKLKTIYDKI